ncbi:dephospho-CoA kinase [Blattabacterium cuenoti]|uniref:dephospho-CoA kinase n=1 Tax=Blattabacterium cuenoti TaxID=1653831 RepID=UPI00163C2A18|nr:dephospho-CoA kinase [Blattabacterium cuenoti]
MKSLLIGITGKMGTGKSLFTTFFKKMGVPIYHSDKKCKKLMNEKKYIKTKIIKYFGKKSYLNNKINTHFLSKTVFNNIYALKLLCSIIHPWVFLDFNNWIKSKKTLYYIKESSLLFESGTYKYCHLIITIVSPIKKMIERIIQRDNLNEEQIMNRINFQTSNKEKIKYSNIIIHNNIHNTLYLENKAKNIHNKIIKKIYQIYG